MRYKPCSCLQTLELGLIVALIALALVYTLPRLSGTSKKSNEAYTTPTSAYSYAAHIKSPDEMGAGPKGNYTTLNKDVLAMTGYIDVLVSGNSTAQDVSGPLGSKYFLDTGATCTSSKDGSTVQRYAYINNIPDGDIPLLSGAMGTKFTQYEGLVPGILEDLGYIDPTILFKAFDSAESDCTEITMDVRDNNNDTGNESQYVADSDISTYNPCWFPDNKNPITGDSC